MESCIYEGIVSHCRRSPVEHRFQYSLFMMYLDLDELPALIDRHAWLSARRLAPVSFLRGDHFGDPEIPLDQAVRKHVAEQIGRQPQGPIRVLTQLRYWGLYFSPLNLFYGFDREGQHIDWVLAEVSNTPWNQRYCYVLWDGNRIDGSSQSTETNRYRHGKTFHVSPFMGMDAEYDWQLSRPGSRLNVALKTIRDGNRFFQANMSLNRRELTGRSFATTLVRFPWMTAKIVGGIYFEAMRLWWKKLPYYPHPEKTIRQSLEPPAASSDEAV